ncbi:MAG: TonB-dependent receptor [Proteobacteria bacterium]|nr:TonB-dependent receptor [Pseudomonadota bacterium]
MPGATRSRTTSVLSIATLLILLLATAAHAQIRLDLPAQPLSQSLTAVGTLGHLNVMFDPSIVDGLQAPALKGDLSADDALTRLLSGTELHAIRVDANTVRVIAEPAPRRVRNAGATNSAASFGPGPVSLRLAAAAAVSSATGDEDSPAGSRTEFANGQTVSLAEVVVTGSRLLAKSSDTPLGVHTYSRDQIDKAGESSVSEFLNTLPQVSTADPSLGNGGATTVRLHGMPNGTTLVLVNGRRMSPSAAQAAGDFFDLNNIPLAAVDRIEVVPSGSSAIYGSDALAGVVNIILKKDVSGVTVESKYDASSRIRGSLTSLSLGGTVGNLSGSLILSFQKRDNLYGSDRAITSQGGLAVSELTDANYSSCSPTNVFSVDGVTPLPGLGGATYAATSPHQVGSATLASYQATANTLNSCGLYKLISLLPRTKRTGALAQATYTLGNSSEIFAEMLFSRVEQVIYGPQYAFGGPDFQQFTASPDNPFNPFGTAVGISGSILTQSSPFATNFYRPVLGVRGQIFGRWGWEIAGSYSAEYSNENFQHSVPDTTAIQNALNSSDPATALNPFTDGAWGPQSLLNSLFLDQNTRYRTKTATVDGYVRGEPIELASGPIGVVLGSEANRTTLDTDSPFLDLAGLSRHTYAVFGEIRVPLWSLWNNLEHTRREALAVDLAARYDHYSDFGGKATPQISAEWRPTRHLVLRGSYGESFKAPALAQLYLPTTTSVQPVTDPVLGTTQFVPTVVGGNPALRPSTGHSYTLSLGYRSSDDRHLTLNVGYWRIKSTNSVQQLTLQQLVNNETVFPGAVVRQSGPTSPIIQVNDIFLNYGSFDVDGVDYDASIRVSTKLGNFTPSVSLSQTLSYRASLLVGSPPTNRAAQANDDGYWAPRFKGAASLSWSLGGLSLDFTGRYVSGYRDYDPLPSGNYLQLGNFWLMDTEVRWRIPTQLTRGFGAGVRTSEIGIGGVNLFDRRPQYSNYAAPYGPGYDPYQFDIRGRILYARVLLSW